MRCPYQACGAELSFSSDRSNCDSCFRPLVICLGCESAQRAFSRFCAQCGEKISLPELEDNIAKSLRDNLEPIRVGGVRRLNPQMVSYGGALWLLSERGEIFDTVDGSKLKRRTTLPGKNYTFPFNVEEDDQLGPLIYTNNNQAFGRYRIFADKYDELLAADGKSEAFLSSVLRTPESCFYLTPSEDSGSFRLKSTRPSEWSCELNGVTPFGSNVQPLCQIGNDLWVVGREKLIVLPRFSPAERKEFEWNPLRAWISSNGILYSERLETGYLGDKQRLTQITFEGNDFDLYSSDELFPFTAKVAVSAVEGQIAIFRPESITTYDSTMNIISQLPGVAHVNDPEAILFMPPFLFWFESDDRSVYAWWTKTSRVWKLSSFENDISFSCFALVGGSLYGAAHEDIWKWDLLAA